MYSKASKFVNPYSLLEMKMKKEKITMLTAYDYTMARLCAKADVDVILVGDSASNVVLGNSTTIPITLDEMIFLAKGVVRGNQVAGGKSMVVFDLPFLSYHISESDAIKNIGTVMKQTNVHAIKLEGGAYLSPLVTRLTQIGVPVMGHVGLMPQSVNKYGGFELKGNSEKEADDILNDAIELEKAGAFAIVLEKIPQKLTRQISETVKIPTIGIGAGVGTDGQVLVINDLLGLNKAFKPKFVRRYAELEDIILDSIKNYMNDVKSLEFPSDKESF